MDVGEEEGEEARLLRGLCSGEPVCAAGEAAGQPLGAQLLHLLWAAARTEERFSSAKVAALQALNVCALAVGGGLAAGGEEGGAAQQACRAAAQAVGAEVMAWSQRSMANEPRVSEAAVRCIKDLSAV